MCNALAARKSLLFSLGLEVSNTSWTINSILPMVAPRASSSSGLGMDSFGAGSAWLGIVAGPLAGDCVSFGAAGVSTVDVGSLVDGDGDLVESGAESLEFDAASLESDSAPLESDPAPFDVDAASLELGTASLEFGGTAFVFEEGSFAAGEAATGAVADASGMSAVKGAALSRGPSGELGADMGVCAQV